MKKKNVLSALNESLLQKLNGTQVKRSVLHQVSVPVLSFRSTMRIKVDRTDLCHRRSLYKKKGGEKSSTTTTTASSKEVE